MAAPRIDRRLTAVLAADVVGYSRLVQRDEQGTLGRLKAHRQELVEPLIAEHGGRVVKLMGDGILCEFPSAVDAVACAVAIQQGMAEREQAVPEAERIRFRIGINLGDVVHEGGDILGDGVNIAARLEALAEPGGVLSRATCTTRSRTSSPSASSRPAGSGSRTSPSRSRSGACALGGSRHGAGRLPCRRPASLCAAAAAVLLLALAHRRRLVVVRPAATPTRAVRPSLDRPAIAVLPFDDLGGDERQQRIADAFTEDLITELARSRELLVIARNSVEAFKGKGADVRQVGRELGVRYVLEGSLQVEPERVRITAQLIEASTGAHLWSERYDRPANDLFAVRDEVLDRLVGTLTGYDGPIWAEWREAARRKPPQSLGAWDYFLLANTPYRRHDKEGNAEARRLLEKAIELDPGLARAWEFLADTHCRTGSTAGPATGPARWR